MLIFNELQRRHYKRYVYLVAASLFLMVASTGSATAILPPVIGIRFEVAEISEEFCDVAVLSAVAEPVEAIAENAVAEPVEAIAENAVAHAVTELAEVAEATVL